MYANTPEADEIETESTSETEQEQPKKRRGRPPRAGKSMAPSPRDDEKEDEFFAMLKTLDPSTAIYLYAIQPVRDNTLIGRTESNIDKVRAEQFDRDYLRDMHGYGVYQAQVEGNGPKCKLWMMEPQLQGERPKFDLRAANLPVNEWWIDLWTRRGYWPPPGIEKKEKDSMAEKTAIDGLNNTVEKLLRERERDGGSKGTMEMLMLVMQQQRESSDKQFQLLMALLTKPADKPAAASESGPMLEILQRQVEAAQTRADKFEERYLDQLAQRGPADAPEMDWPTAAVEIGKSLGPALTMVARSLSRPLAIEEAQTSNPAAEPQQPNPKEEDDPEMFAKLRLLGHLKDAIDHMLRNGNGADFAVQLVGVKGEKALYLQMRDDYGADVIVSQVQKQDAWKEAMAKVPKSAQAAALTRLNAYVNEFLTAYDEQPAAAAAPEPPAAPAPKAAPKGKGKK